MLLEWYVNVAAPKKVGPSQRNQLHLRRENCRSFNQNGLCTLASHKVTFSVGYTCDELRNYLFTFEIFIFGAF